MDRLRSFAARPAPALLTACALVAASAFLAAPAQAQVPAAKAPKVVWYEDFENSSDTMPVPVAATNPPYAGTKYIGGLNEVYTADGDWLPQGTVSTGSGPRCNGWVVDSIEATPPADGGCTALGGVYVSRTTNGNGPANAWDYLRRMAYVMGLAQGLTPTEASINAVVASMTNGQAGAALTQPDPIQLSINSVPVRSDPSNPASPIIPYVPQKGHFYIASAMFAAVHCRIDMGTAGVTGWTTPVENVNLLVNGVEQGSRQYPGAAADPGNICPPSTSGAGTLKYYDPPSLPTAVDPAHTYYPYTDNPPASGAGNIFVVTRHSEPYQAKTGDTSLGFIISNTQTSGNANDVAFDLARIQDATPMLYKSFNAADPQDHRDGAITVGGTGTLTFIIVNTDDYLEKDGWSFTDQLPKHVTIATPANVHNTCAAGTVTLAADGTWIKVEGGRIAEGDPLIPSTGMCTISVNVTSDAPGVYVNDVNAQPAGDDGGITETDLVPDESGPAKLYVNNLFLKKTATATDAGGNAKTDGVVTKAGDLINYTFTLANQGTADDAVLDLTTLVWIDPEPQGPDGIGFTGLGDPLSIGNCKLDDGSPMPATLPPNPNANLDGSPICAGTCLVCTATYEVVQADINAIAADPTVVNGLGQIRNVAIASVDAFPPDDPTDLIPLTSTPGRANVPVRATNELTLSKVADMTVLPEAGTVVTYTVTIANEGNTTLHDVVLTDTFTGNHGTSTTTCKDNTQPTNLTVPYASLTTAPGVVMEDGYAIVCTTKYTVDANDTDVVNTATAEGKKPGDDPVPPPDPVEVELKPLVMTITLTKSATVNGSDTAPVTKVGDKIVYTFKLKNVGPTALSTGVIGTSSLVWTDPSVDPTAAPPLADGFTGVGTGGLSIGNCTVDGAPAPAELANGKTLVCTTAEYTVTQADIDNAVTYTGDQILNTNAYVTMDVYPSGHPEEAAERTSPKASYDVKVKPQPKLTLTKTANKTTLPAAGTTVIYTITFKNDGNVTLYDVSLADVFTGTGTPNTSCKRGSADVDPLAGVITMAPGETIACSTEYVVTDDDVAAGKLTNTAQAKNDPSDPLKVERKTTSDERTVDLLKYVPGATAIPTLDPSGLALLALMLGAFAWRMRRGRWS